jgi:hypothetical protein
LARETVASHVPMSHESDMPTNDLLEPITPDRPLRRSTLSQFTAAIDEGDADFAGIAGILQASALDTVLRNHRG